MRPYLVGKRINLRGLTREQIQPNTAYYDWLDDLSLDLASERSYFPNSVQRMEAYFDAACANTRLILLGIFDNESERHIGNITLQEIDWINRRAFLGYLVGNKEFTGKGVATQASLMMMYYGFNKLNFERIWTTVSAENVASRRVAEKAGLKIEGCLRGHQLRKGSRRDLLVVGALRDEWMAERGAPALEAFAEPPI